MNEIFDEKIQIIGMLLVLKRDKAAIAAEVDIYLLKQIIFDERVYAKILFLKMRKQWRW